MADVCFPNIKALATKAYYFNEKNKAKHCYVCHNISPEIASNKRMTPQAEHKRSSAVFKYSERQQTGQPVALFCLSWAARGNRERK